MLRWLPLLVIALAACPLAAWAPPTRFMSHLIDNSRSSPEALQTFQDEVGQPRSIDSRVQPLDLLWEQYNPFGWPTAIMQAVRQTQDGEFRRNSRQADKRFAVTQFYNHMDLVGKLPEVLVTYLNKIDDLDLKDGKANLKRLFLFVSKGYSPKISYDKVHQLGNLYSEESDGPFLEAYTSWQHRDKLFRLSHHLAHLAFKPGRDKLNGLGPRPIYELLYPAMLLAFPVSKPKFAHFLMKDIALGKDKAHVKKFKIAYLHLLDKARLEGQDFLSLQLPMDIVNKVLAHELNKDPDGNIEQLMKYADEVENEYYKNYGKEQLPQHPRGGPVGPSSTQEANEDRSRTLAETDSDLEEGEFRPEQAEGSSRQLSVLSDGSTVRRPRRSTQPSVPVRQKWLELFGTGSEPETESGPSDEGFEGYPQHFDQDLAGSSQMGSNNNPPQGYVHHGYSQGHDHQGYDQGYIQQGSVYPPQMDHAGYGDGTQAAGDYGPEAPRLQRWPDNSEFYGNYYPAPAEYEERSQDRHGGYDAESSYYPSTESRSVENSLRHLPVKKRREKFYASKH